MAHIEDLNFWKHKEKDFSVINRVKSIRSTLKKKTYPELKNPRNLKSSVKLGSHKLLRENIQIALSDFWSGKMIAEIRYLEKKHSTNHSNNLLYSTPKSNSRKPLDFRRRSTCVGPTSEKPAKNFKGPFEIIPALQKLIEDCDDFQKNSRKLSGEFFPRNKKYKKF